MVEREFKVLNEVTIYEDKYRRFTKADIIRGNETGIYTFAHLGDFVGVVPLDPHQRTVVVKTYRYPLRDYLWEFCLGGVDKGEAPDLAALRELREETQIDTHRVIALPASFQCPGLTSRVFYPFIAPVASDVLDTALCPENMDEIVEIKTVTLDAVGRMINTGEFRDLPSIAMYFHVRQYLADQRNDHT